MITRVIISLLPIKQKGTKMFQFAILAAFSLAVVITFGLLFFTGNFD